MTDDELMHYGKKGMKWGVRKGSSIKVSKDSKEVARLKQKKLPELSNEQLRTINNRMTLEKSYKDLNISAVKQGQNYVKDVLSVIGTVSAVIAVTQSPLGKKTIQLGKNAVYKTKYLTGVTKAITAG